MPDQKTTTISLALERIAVGNDVQSFECEVLRLRQYSIPHMKSFMLAATEFVEPSQSPSPCEDKDLIRSHLPSVHQIFRAGMSGSAASIACLPYFLRYSCQRC